MYQSVRRAAAGALYAAASFVLVSLPATAATIPVPPLLDHDPLHYAQGSGTGLRGSYWQLAPRAVPAVADALKNYVPNNVYNTPATGAFVSSAGQNNKGVEYLGNDLTDFQTWLGPDGASYTGPAGNLDDGVIRLTGWIRIPSPGTLRIQTNTDDGSLVYVNGALIVDNDGSHGDVTVFNNANFLYAGMYPIEVRFFNGDWTSDGTGDNLNHSGNPDPGVHGGANFRITFGATGNASETVDIYQELQLVPEPATLALMGLGIGSLLVLARRRR